MIQLGAYSSFQNGLGVPERNQEVTKVFPFHKWQQIYQVYQVPF